MLLIAKIYGFGCFNATKLVVYYLTTHHGLKYVEQDPIFPTVLPLTLQIFKAEHLFIHSLFEPTL